MSAPNFSMAYYAPGVEAVATICDAHGVTLHFLRKGNRRTWVSAIRRECMAALRDLDWTLEDIGVYMRRNHATVIWNLRKAGAV